MKLVPIILLILIVAALSGCTGSKETVTTEAQKHERANLNLDAAIVKVKFDRDNVIAGEKVLAELVVGNTGSEKITNETVEIKAIAREAGSRSKIAVASTDPNVDPVGSCVGQKGVRVSAVMSEISGEKIDIIPWFADPQKFIAAALLPAKVLEIQIDEERKEAAIEVEAGELSLAIGKGGQNVRLAAKLTGYRIDIRGAEEEPLEELTETSEQEETEGIKEVPAIKEELAEADEKAE